MKVTVCFGDTRVVVPCGQGEFLVSELIEKAITRYRKAVGKASDHYVHIHTLKSQSDGGILDLDDILSDVVDDREQIIAEYEEHNGPSAPQGGDGTSGSSVGSSSPEVFQTHRKMINPVSIPNKSMVSAQLSAQNRASPSLPSHVRASPSLPLYIRSSPALMYSDKDKAADKQQKVLEKPGFRQNAEGLPSQTNAPTKPNTSYQQKHISLNAAFKTQSERSTPPLLNNNIDNRYSVEVTAKELITAGAGLQVLSVRRDSEPNIVHAVENEIFTKSDLQTPQPSAYSKNSGSLQVQRLTSGESSSDDESLSPGFNKFARDSSRQSLNTKNVLKWASAQEKQQDSLEHELPIKLDYPIQNNIQRHEPLGQSRSPGEEETPAPVVTDSHFVRLKNEGGPLGIHVVPHRNEEGRECGLAIQGIEPGGQVERSGQFKVNDVIIEINGRSLLNASFLEAQEIFRDALHTEDLRIQLRRPVSMIEKGDQSMPDVVSSGGPRRVSASSLFKSAPPPPPVRSPGTSLTLQTFSFSATQNQPAVLSPEKKENLTSPTSPPLSLVPSNSRKLGKKFSIDLVKGPEGLGFSITTRDNPAGSVAAPIYVKNILPKGAAIIDGRLKSGDRLLEVNGLDITGKLQDEVVTILRNTKRGSTVTLTVSRVESGDSTSSLPRPMPKEMSSTVEPAASGDTQVLSYNIPLNETGSAGLGISVKGKTTANDGEIKDLGIFIKSVIHGGAASKDGRLQINDQLLSVNDDDLVNKTNGEAMESLRKAMHTEGPYHGFIKITVARKAEPSLPSPKLQSSMEPSLTSTPALLPPQEKPVVATAPESGIGNLNNMETLKNPVLDRITRGNNSKLRNESYHRATSDSSDKEDGYEPIKKYTSPNTVTIPSRTQLTSDIMMIENDYEQTVLQQPIKKQPEILTKPIPSSSADTSKAVREEQKHQEDKSIRDSTDSLAAPTPDSDNMNTFDREAFGRRSFSEKRKASNGKSKEVVEKVKALRELSVGRQDPKADRKEEEKKTEQRLENKPLQKAEQKPVQKEEQKTELKPVLKQGNTAAALDSNKLVRVGSAESLLSVSNTHAKLSGYNDNTAREVNGPNLGLAKSSSLESLQAFVKDSQKPPDYEGNYYKPRSRVARGRGCNESFRAAVDRSYVPPGANDSDSAQETNEFTNLRGAPLNASFSGEPDSEKKKEKKSKTLLGLLRLTKPRKSLEERSKVTKDDKEKQRPKAQEADNTLSMYTPDVQNIAQDHYKKLQEKLKNAAENHNQQPEHGTYPRGERLRINPTGGVPPPLPANGPERSDRLAAIRADHQKKHQERHGLYPNEAAEDFYEKKIREREWDVSSRTYNAGTEFTPRLKVPAAGTSSNGQNRYSFYADPRYHDYHRSTPTDFTPMEKNIASKQMSSLAKPTVRQETTFNSLPKRSLDSTTLTFNTNSYQPPTHQRYKSSDSQIIRQAPNINNSNNNVNSAITSRKYESRVDDSLYAQIRKPPLGNTISNPARV